MATAPQKIILKSSRVDSSILPGNFSTPYRLHVQQQSSEIDNIVNSTNNANQVAYEATLKNEEQDEILDDHSQRISNIEGDYVSKAAVTLQSIASPISVTTSYSISGIKVVGARQTGFTAATGTAFLGAFDTEAGQVTVSATYVQSQVQTIANAGTSTRRRVKAIEDALRSHGLID